MRRGALEGHRIEGGVEQSADEAAMQERISRLDVFRQSFMEVETSSFFFTIEKVVYERDA